MDAPKQVTEAIDTINAFGQYLDADAGWCPPAGFDATLTQARETITDWLGIARVDVALELAIAVGALVADGRARIGQAA